VISDNIITLLQEETVRKRTFKGGIHPFEGKEMSREQKTVMLPADSEMVFPLSQSIGAPSKPVVSKGDRVLRGQLIAEPGGFVSSAVHSSVSGTVKAIEPRTLATGGRCMSIVIENDGKEESAEMHPMSLDSLSKEEILKRIRDGGVVGMGGAGFPTAVKLSPKNPDKIDTIIVNGAECEPYLTSDFRRMLEDGEALVQGLQVILKLFDNAHGYFAIEANKPEAIARMQELTKGMDRISVVPLKTKYPQGGERTIIKAVTGRELNSKLLPADVGAIVDNVDTVYAIKCAVLDGMPLMERIITVTGDGVKNPQNFRVHLGTSYASALKAAGGPVGTPEKYISGGPMMGFAMYSLDVPLIKGSSCLLVFRQDPVSKLQESACINCCRCSDGCPERLLPSKLADFSARGDFASFEKYHGLECVECGSCSWSCPAKRPLTQLIKSARRQILAEKKKAAAEARAKAQAAGKAGK
jgi:electron transport complex protein RnfC